MQEDGKEMGVELGKDERGWQRKGRQEEKGRQPKDTIIDAKFILKSVSPWLKINDAHVNGTINTSDSFISALQS